MALSTPPDSAESWIEQKVLMLGSSLGAPPEPAIPAGQNWGGTPPHPERLRAMNYRPLVQNLRRNMQSAAMLRIDHGMQLQRLYCIPPGASNDQGVYISYPVNDLMKIVALESHRNSCMVVCEDLGTVDEAFRQAMREFGAYGYEIQQNAPEKPPSAYRRESVVTGTNHDTPSIDSYWMGADIVFRLGAGEIDHEQAEREIQEREHDLGRRMVYFSRNGFELAGFERPQLFEEAAVATYAGLAGSPAAIVMVSMQDLDQNPLIENMPGRQARFDYERPWPLLFNRRTLSPEALENSRRFQRIAEAMRRNGRG